MSKQQEHTEQSRVVGEQTRRNFRARRTWDLYQEHRERVMALLDGERPAERDPRRLCVLGAGNCNDIDLAALTERCDEVHLVDLDAQALVYASEQQPPNVQQRLTLHGGVDVTGVLASLNPPPSGGALSAPDIDVLAASLMQRVELDLPAPFDVVASIGLFTQLIDTLAHVVGPDHPRLLELIASLRSAHLRLLVELLAPGGRGVFVTELVSSDTFPELPQVAEATLPHVLGQLLARKNFFTGANPAVLQTLLASEPFVALIRDVEFTLPWRWRFVDRTYAVYGVSFTRR